MRSTSLLEYERTLASYRRAQERRIYALSGSEKLLDEKCGLSNSPSTGPLNWASRTLHCDGVESSLSLYCFATDASKRCIQFATGPIGTRCDFEAGPAFRFHSRESLRKQRAVNCRDEIVSTSRRHQFNESANKIFGMCRLSHRRRNKAHIAMLSQKTLVSTSHDSYNARGPIHVPAPELYSLRRHSHGPLRSHSAPHLAFRDGSRITHPLFCVFVGGRTSCGRLVAEQGRPLHLGRWLLRAYGPNRRRSSRRNAASTWMT